jgi:hypothetical protein
MELNVTLKAQVGEKKHPQLGKIEVPLNQYSIKVNGKQIGLVCKAPGSPINFLPIANNFPLEVREKIAELVKAELVKLNGDTANRNVFQPPSQESVDEASALIAKMAKQESGDDEDDDSNL